MAPAQGFAHGHAPQKQSGQRHTSYHHHSEAFLNSLYIQARVHAPRLHTSGAQTFIAHPSLLQRWGVIASEAAAAYNHLVNTLILQPEMTIFDPQYGRERVRTMFEIREVTKTYASPPSAVIFHELSHAEWDLYVEEKAADYDRELLAVFQEELPKIAKLNGLSRFKTRLLASEIFAYYREDLLFMILMDMTDIKIASGLDPDTNACLRTGHRVDTLKILWPNSPEHTASYKDRIRLQDVWVMAEAINLGPATDTLNQALFRHAERSMTFPKNREHLLKMLQRDQSLQRDLTRCREAKST
jgi:hypothetical protein